MNVSEELQWRGLIKDRTFEDTAWLDEPKTFYLGADVGSADSLTIGNLAIYVLAKRLVNAGWQPVMLVGGATSLIGDPGGKNEERSLVSREVVEHNKAAIAAQVRRLLERDDLMLVDNYDWFKDIGYLDFLRDIGKHYSMTELMQRDYIADRIGEGKAGISYAEFSYSLIQGYDFWHLFKNHQVVLQIGGSDQWGNMLSGVPLVRKKEGAEVHAMSMPLVINKTTGAKFGKSETGAVWLDEAKTSVYQFYQFWLNLDDAGVEDYLKIYTFLTPDEITNLMTEFAANPGSRSAQKRLAYEVTCLVHGTEKTEAVIHATNVLFGSEDFLTLQAAELDVLRGELPTVACTDDLYQMVVEAGLANSKTEARQFHASGALAVNGTKVLPEQTIEFRNGLNLLKRGKNSFALLNK